MQKLSIVILNHNTKELLEACLRSLGKVEDFNIIVSDNASTDGSGEMVKKSFPWVKLIENKTNLGYAAGNNAAKKYCDSEFILFLNSDVVVAPGAIRSAVDYLKDNKDVGALTAKVVLPDGQLDKDVRRSFPTPWVSFSHFSGLDRVFPKSKLFAKYWYGYKSEDEIDEVDVIQGAFFLTRRKVLDKVNWFDEDYFLDGEDIDICWKIKKAGWKIVYYPKVSLIHYKKASKLKVKSLKNVMAGVDSMEIFYRKHLWSKYPFFVSWGVISGIKVLKFVRYVKFYL